MDIKDKSNKENECENCRAISELLNYLPMKKRFNRTKKKKNMIITIPYAYIILIKYDNNLIDTNNGFKVQYSKTSILEILMNVFFLLFFLIARYICQI